MPSAIVQLGGLDGRVAEGVLDLLDLGFVFERRGRKRAPQPVSGAVGCLFTEGLDGVLL